jgi:hypothetical protein
MATPRKDPKDYIRERRPTKYKRDFHNEDFIRLCKKGKGIDQIALEWEVDRTTIYEWIKVHLEFSLTVKKGKTYIAGWYANLGQMAMMGMTGPTGKKIDNTMFIWMTKNICKWSDKVEQKSETKDTKSAVQVYIPKNESEEI